MPCCYCGNLSLSSKNSIPAFTISKNCNLHHSHHLTLLCFWNWDELSFERGIRKGKRYCLWFSYNKLILFSCCFSCQCQGAGLNGDLWHMAVQNMASLSHRVRQAGPRYCAPWCVGSWGDQAAVNGCSIATSHCTGWKHLLLELAGRNLFPSLP